MTIKTCLLGAAAALGLAVPASAAVVVPSSGLASYGLYFDGGDAQLDEILTDEFATSLGFDGFTLTLGSTSVVELTFRDAFVPGDEYGLIVDGQATAFTAEGFDPQGYFRGDYRATLDAGTYAFSYAITDPVGGLPAGAFATFQVAPVPLPASAPLALAALGALGLAARRRRAA